MRVLYKSELFVLSNFPSLLIEVKRKKVEKKWHLQA